MDHADTEFEAEGADYSPEGAAVFADVLEQVILGELSEMRGLMAGLTRTVAAKAATAEKPEDLSRLNTAAVKSARAHRQIAVLQLEILGKRPVSGQGGAGQGGAGQGCAGQGCAGQREHREPSAAPRSGAGPQVRVGSLRERFPDGLPFRKGDYNDYDDYTDDERKQLNVARFFHRLEPVVAAMDEDFAAAGRADIQRQSPQTKFKLIFYVPHPATDRAIAASKPEDICTIFGMGGILPPVAGTGPPEVWERFNENCRLRDRNAPRAP